MASLTLHGRALALVELVQRGWLRRAELTLDAPADLAEPGDAVELRDPEGVLLGTLTVTAVAEGTVTGTPALVQPPPRYDHADLRVDAAEAVASSPRLVLAAAAPLTAAEVAHLADLVGSGGMAADGADALLLTLAGPGATDDYDAQTVIAAHRRHVARWRAAGVAVRHVVLPVAGEDEVVAEVVEGTGAEPVGPSQGSTADGSAGEAGDGPLDPEVADLLGRRRPGPAQRGLTLFLTGLSGSGKSTVAGAVMARLHAETDRTITLLDGDLVRQHLSSELTFSREHRDLNITRIGFVAAQVTKHRGVAICAPIAPYAATRQAVREMVEAHGTFVLVHVATPLEVCEQRDRKGLYAKARAGEIASFTGISDPYEAPEDPDLRLDTSTMTVADAADAVLGLLRERGLVEG